MKVAWNVGSNMLEMRMCWLACILCVKLHIMTLSMCSGSMQPNTWHRRFVCPLTKLNQIFTLTNWINRQVLACFLTMHSKLSNMSSNKVQLFPQFWMSRQSFHILSYQSLNAFTYIDTSWPNPNRLDYLTSTYVILCGLNFNSIKTSYIYF